MPASLSIDPFEAVRRSVAEQDHVAAEARRLVAETRQDAVRVAGLKVLAAVSVQRVELLERFGAIPSGPEWMNELRASAAWRAMSEVAQAAGLDLDELRAITRQRIAEYVRLEEAGGSLEVAPLAPVPRRPMREAA